jgi:hypothetical protein
MRYVMKTLAVAMVIVGGLAAWIPAARAEEYSATFGKNHPERAETSPADNSHKNVRSRNHAAGTSGDQSNAQPDRTITQESRETVSADTERTNAHNDKVMTANFQALYDGMSDAQKKTAGAVFRRHMSAAEPPR